MVLSLVWREDTGEVSLDSIERERILTALDMMSKTVFGGLDGATRESPEASFRQGLRWGARTVFAELDRKVGGALE